MKLQLQKWVQAIEVVSPSSAFSFDLSKIPDKFNSLADQCEAFFCGEGVAIAQVLLEKRTMEYPICDLKYIDCGAGGEAQNAYLKSFKLSEQGVFYCFRGVEAVPIDSYSPELLDRMAAGWARISGDDLFAQLEPILRREDSEQCREIVNQVERLFEVLDMIADEHLST